MHIGVIADDLTGATDIAGFLANGGLDVVQFMGVPETPPPDAAVVSLKSRSIPVNKRTVKKGILYVDGVPLAETGMRHHPVNPMTYSDLTRLMEMQSPGKAGVVSLETVRE